MQRLILLFDGTWNDDTKEGRFTNIVHLRTMLESANRNPTLGIKQRIYYDQGVGTTWFDRIPGGALGIGLSTNVKQGYRFLSQFYVDGPGPERDQIYLFGFSRGAFTARSLGGFIAASGLLRREMCSAANLERAWRYYRTPIKSRMPAEKAELEKLCYQDLKIDFLGVFDTVGALGIPGTRAIFGSTFHDTKLGSSIRFAYHAIALDEHRIPFVPALWAFPDHANNEGVEQVWFPGVHSDVGGGYPKSPDEESGKCLTVSDIALDWMINRVRAKTGLALDYRGLDRTKPIQRLHDSLGYYLSSRATPMTRLVNGVAVPDAAPTYRVAPPDQSMNERVHISVLQLWQRGVEMDGKPISYRPPALQAAIDQIKDGKLKAVGFEGDELAPGAAMAFLT